MFLQIIWPIKEEKSEPEDRFASTHMIECNRVMTRCFEDESDLIYITAETDTGPKDFIINKKHKGVQVYELNNNGRTVDCIFRG